MLFVFVFSVSVFRAFTQSLVIDEAYSWSLYLSENLRAILTRYDANNHVLYTLLAWISVSTFGDAEWAIRLPALGGCLVWLTAVWRLTGGRLLPSAALTLNPLALDFMAAARGYGLGVGLWLWMLALLRQERLRAAGIAAGLAVAANLTLVFPVTGVALVELVRRWRNVWTYVYGFAIPAAVAAFLLLAIPLSWAQAGAFYVGAKGFEGTVRSLVLLSTGQELPWAAAAVGLALAAAAWRARRLAAALAVTLALLVLANLAAGLPYPENRTGLYLIPFATLLAIEALPRRAEWLLLPLIAVYALEFRTGWFGEWAWDRNTREIVRRLDAEAHSTAGGKLRVGVSWPLEQSVNYYRQRLGLAWMMPVDRTPPDGAFDYYLLLPDDHGIIARRGLRTLHDDAETGVRIAKAAP